MQGLTQAQQQYDTRLPTEAVLIDTTEYDAERDLFSRSAFVIVTETQIEQFIIDLVAASNKDIFQKDTVDLSPSAFSAVGLHMSVARQWILDKEKLGDFIGSVFWKWARNAAIEAAK